MKWAKKLSDTVALLQLQTDTSDDQHQASLESGSHVLVVNGANPVGEPLCRALVPQNSHSSTQLYTL